MWRTINGYEGLYEVSSEGEVASLRFNHTNNRKIIRQSCNTNGYRIVKLYKHGNKNTTRVHRLVAQAFLPNPNGYDQVNHKDGVRTNNCMQNLEWVDNSENQKHSVYCLHTNYFAKVNKPIKVRDSETNKLYRSISEASRDTGVSKQAVKSGLRFIKEDS